MKFRTLFVSFTIFIFTNCFPELKRSDLEFVNILSFLSQTRSSGDIQYPIQIELYSMAYGEIQIQHLNEEPITLNENSTTSVTLSTLTASGNLDFQILKQPTDHDCRIVNPNAVYQEGLILEVNCFSLLSSTPVDGGIIPPATSIVLQFSDSITFDPLDTDASFTDVNLEAAGAPNFVQSQTQFPNDTLAVTPGGAGWSAGLDKFVGFLFQNANGKPQAAGESIINMTVASTLRYVSTTGSDINDGFTPTTPLANIQTAITQMSPCADQACLVLTEEGSYDAAAIGDFIQMEEGISLHGSYTNGSNFTLRTPDSRNSIIEFQTASVRCGNVADYCAPIFVPMSVTDVTNIEGFTIQSTASLNTFGMYLNQASPRIINNTIKGGDIAFASGEGGGLYINDGGNPIIENSRIEGGNCTAGITTSAGIEINDSAGVTTTPTITDSFFIGGNCNVASGHSIGMRIIVFGGSLVFSELSGTEIRSGDAGEFSIGVDADVAFTLPSQQNIYTGNAPSVIGIRNSFFGGQFIIGDITNNTNIQLGQGASLSKGLDIDGTFGDLDIYNLTINMGNTIDPGMVESYGMQIIVDGSVKIAGNTIIMGTVQSGGSTANAYGINIANDDNTSIINRNTIQMSNLITGNLSGTNFGIYWDGTNEAIIANNLVYGGTSNLNSYGVYLLDNTLGTRIFHNTITSGTALDPNKGIVLGVGGLNPTKMMIRNNIFLSNPGMNICMQMPTNPTNTGAIQSNVFHNCSEILVATDSFDTICGTGNLGKNACTTPATDILHNGNLEFEGNRITDPILVSPFASPFNLNPMNGTPCSISQDSNVLAGSTEDRFSNPRPSPINPGTVSLGAIQYEGTCVP